MRSHWSRIVGQPTWPDHHSLPHFCLAAFLVVVSLPLFGGSGASQGTLEIIALDSQGQVIAGASVVLEQPGGLGPLTNQTGSDGACVFPNLRFGVYSASAEKDGFRKVKSKPLELSTEAVKRVELTLEAVAAEKPGAAGPHGNSPPTKDPFFDPPKFVVAGVTGATSFGSHGSTARADTSEALIKDTLSLKQNSPSQTQRAPTSNEDSTAEQGRKLLEAANQAPSNFEANHQLGEIYLHAGEARDAVRFLQRAYEVDSGDYLNRYDLASAYFQAGDYEQARTHIRALLDRKDDAVLRHLLADSDERLGDPLEAVREYERAARLFPSDDNIFDWGTELLLHQAMQPAADVFTDGIHLHPKSAKLLMGLGVALYALGSDDGAVGYLCKASDMDPADPNPYLFLGRMQITASALLQEVQQRQARFVRLQPGNSWANYYYALSLWNRGTAMNVAGLKVESLLNRAVALDPKLADGYFHLGLLYDDWGRYSDAMHSYQGAIAANSDFPEPHYRLALDYKRDGQISRARQELQWFQRAKEKAGAESERRSRETQQFLFMLREQSQPK